jgi:hypothetical protein
MQALKQAAREGDSAKLDALCEEWSVPPAAPSETPSTAASPAARNQEAVANPVSSQEPDAPKNAESATTSKTGVGARR